MILHITIEEMISFVQIPKNLYYILVIEHRHKEKYGGLKISDNASSYEQVLAYSAFLASLKTTRTKKLYSFTTLINTISLA
jgi:hypothetical protein